MSWSLKSVSVAGCVLAMSALAASPAGAFERSQEILLHKSDHVENVSVARNGNLFLSETERIPGAAFDTVDAEKVVELSPHGKRLRTITGAFASGGDVYYMIGYGTVTPNGADVIIAGGATDDGTDPSGPLVAKYSAATGHLIKAVSVDANDNDYTGAVAVDPTGQHIYIADKPRSDAPLPANRIIELNVSDLSVVRQFPLARRALLSDDFVDGIAVGGPDGDVYVGVDASSSATHGSVVQVYRPDGTFIRQFPVAHQAGVAVNPRGDVFTGGMGGFDVHRPDGSDREPGIYAPGVMAEAVDSSDHLYALHWRDSQESIVKYAPEVPQTKIVGSRPPGVTVFSSPKAHFQLKSSTIASTFECRLRRRGFDRVGFTPCPSPQTYSGLPNGKYRLDVRAISFDGAADRTPASMPFLVRATYAHAKITGHPAKLTGDTTATFRFKSNTPGATFKCRLTPFAQPPDAFKPCSSPASYPGLVHDVYSFQVQAITSDGLVQPGAASYSFAVDPVPPAVTVPIAKIASDQQVGPTGALAITYHWSANDPNTPANQLVDTLQVRSAPTVAQLATWSPVSGADHVAGQTSVSVPISPGPFFQVRAQADNALGVTATGPSTDPRRLSVVDDSDPAASYSNGWTAALADAGALGGTVARAAMVGAHATLMLTGTSVGVIGVPGPGRGVLKVCVDGDCTNVETSAPAKTQRKLLFTANGLGDTAHTIKIEASTTPVVIDGFVALH